MPESELTLPGDVKSSGRGTSGDPGPEVNDEEGDGGDISGDLTGGEQAALGDNPLNVSAGGYPIGMYEAYGGGGGWRTHGLYCSTTWLLKFR